VSTNDRQEIDVASPCRREKALRPRPGRLFSVLFRDIHADRSIDRSAWSDMLHQPLGVPNRAMVRAGVGRRLALQPVRVVGTNQITCASIVRPSPGASVGW
jgi:hypothetical protein